MNAVARKEAVELETLFDSFEPVHIDGITAPSDDLDAANSPMAWIWTWQFEEEQAQ